MFVVGCLLWHREMKNLHHGLVNSMQVKLDYGIDRITTRLTDAATGQKITESNLLKVDQTFQHELKLTFDKSDLNLFRELLAAHKSTLNIFIDLLTAQRRPTRSNSRINLLNVRSSENNIEEEEDRKSVISNY